MQTAWLIYIGSTTALLLLCSFLLRRWLSPAVLLCAVLFLLVVLLTPAAVPQTQLLAPAALSAAYEFVFGDRELASQLAKPVVWSAGLALVLLLLWPVIRIRLNKKRSERAPSTQTDQ